jgi:hypothetical protein
MIYLPKYSVGSKVDIIDGESGKIVSIEAILKTGSLKYHYKTIYFVETKDGTKKVGENQIKDSEEIAPEVVTKLNMFLADSLLLTRHSNPNERIDNTIKELLNFKSGGK